MAGGSATVGCWKLSILPKQEVQMYGLQTFLRFSASFYTDSRRNLFFIKFQQNFILFWSDITAISFKIIETRLQVPIIL